MPTTGHIPSRRRPSAQRRAVMDALGRTDRFRDAQQIHQDLRAERHRIGLVTAYRTLHALIELDAVETHRAEDGTVLYRARVHDGHRHYLVCRRCGRAVEFGLPEAEHHARKLASRHGFAELTHYIDFYGTCSDCGDAVGDGPPFHDGPGRGTDGLA